MHCFADRTSPKTDSFDVSNLGAGMYIVRVNYKNTYGKDKVVYLKMIKE